MNTLLDIFGSVIIAGIVFMLIMKLNLFSSQVSYSSDSELKVIQNTKTLAEIIDYDIRKVGYRVSGNAIKTAGPKDFVFNADIDRDGTVDEIEYSVSEPKDVPGTENTKDIILYRRVNSDIIGGPSLGLVDIKFSYLDSAYTETATISKIRYIKTEMWVEGTEATPDAFSDNSSYSKTYWEFTINPRNL
jgi:hypothetical protein